MFRAFVFLLAAASALAAAGPMPFRSVGISRTHIAFSYAGDLWIVERSGGEARRLTSDPNPEDFPLFSPDGTEIAFARDLGGGNMDIFVIPSAGGEARHLTWHPKQDFPAAWSPDGTRLLFSSLRVYDGVPRLYTISRQGGFPSEIALPAGFQGSWSADGKRLAYASHRPVNITWRNYRGGATSPIWITSLADAVTEQIPRANSNDGFPMWIGEKIYFLSDRSETLNLHSFDTRTKKLTQWTRFEKHDVKFAAATQDAIAFLQGGGIHVFDLTSGRSRPLEVSLRADAPERKPRTLKTGRMIRYWELSPDGSQALFGARGELFTVDAATGEARNLTRTSGAAERWPVWSPDGKSIACFSDESGEYALSIRPAAGTGATRKIAIEEHPSFYAELTWSPDSSRLAFSDKRLSLWIAEASGGAPRRIETAPHPDQALYSPAWSVDGRWLAYARLLPNRVRTVFLHSLETGKSVQVSDGRGWADSPAFDKSGRYLYFTASPNAAAANTFGLMMVLFGPSVVRTVHAAVLQKDGVSPLAAAKGADVTTRIDAEGIASRVVTLPLPPKDYIGLAAVKPGVLLVVEQAARNPLAGGGPPSHTVHKLELATRRPEKLLEDVRSLTVSADGGKIIYRKGENWHIVSTAAAPRPEEGTLSVERMEMQLEPAAEWRQMFDEIWRIERDYFYEPGLHGQDLAALKKHYGAYLPNVLTRSDLNFLFQEMLSHLGISHMGVGGGDVPTQKPETVGLLGADFEIDQGRYRITRIYAGDNSMSLLTGPLAQPGVEARPGDYLLAVDGQEITADKNLYSYFVGKSGRPIQIRLGPKPSTEGSRTSSVLAMIGENTLRRFVWVEDNRRKVEQATNGRLGYIYLPDTGSLGYSMFLRDFYAQRDKQGLVVDERFNGGGFPADFFVETLGRTRLSSYAFREGADMAFPAAIVPGPRVMIVNEYAGSGGDTLPWMFRRAGLGPLVGKRTMGAGIGGFVDVPELVDGGRVSAPNRAFFDPLKGAWSIENYGVAPDFDVEITPKDARAGRDPQLEKAIELAMGMLKKAATAPARRPAYPVYK